MYIGLFILWYIYPTCICIKVFQDIGAYHEKVPLVVINIKARKMY